MIGAGAIGQAIARRVAFGRRIILADLYPEAVEKGADVLRDAGFDVTTAPVDVAVAESVAALAALVAQLGDVTHVIHAAGISPVRATPQQIIAVDLVGTALVLEEFGKIVASGGAGIVIASMAGYMLPPLTPEQNAQLATAPVDELANLDFVAAVPDAMAAYCLAKRANSLRTQAAAVIWGDRGARVNAISPGVIMTPLTYEEFVGSSGAGFPVMIQASAAGRVGTPDEIGEACAFLLNTPYITGADLLMDGGIIAAMTAGRIN